MHPNRNAVFVVASLSAVYGCATLGPALEPPGISKSPVILVDVQGADCPDITGTYEFRPYVIEMAGNGEKKQYKEDAPLMFGHLLSRGVGTARDADESELPNRYQMRLFQSTDRLVMETRHLQLSRLHTDIIERNGNYDCSNGYVEFAPRINNSGHEWGVFNYQEVARISKSKEGDLVVYILHGPYRQTMTKSKDDFIHTFFLYKSASE